MEPSDINQRKLKVTEQSLGVGDIKSIVTIHWDVYYYGKYKINTMK